MKRFFTLIMLLLCHYSQAQTTNVFQDNMNVIYQNVNRSFVTTGLLKDYGLLFTDVSKFNGTRQSNNLVNHSVWSALYTSVYLMKFNNNAILTSPEVVSNVIEDYKANDSGTVNLVTLHFAYEQFKSNAISSNLVYVVNNKIYDTPNRPTTPYEIKHAFAVAPLTSILNGASHTFRLRSDLFYKNINKTISTIQIDFGDGLGYQNITLDSDKYVYYNTDGEKTLLFKLTYTDGQILESHSKVLVTDTSSDCTTCRFSTPRTESFPKNDFPVAMNEMGIGTVYIGTAGTDNKLDKPLILVEGFDPENRYSYQTYFQPDGLGIRISLDFSGQTLAQALESSGYDIVFLDFKNGSDDIKRNAYLLENVIQWVNQQKALNNSTEKNVVLGVSMGGLIARYALRDMEIRNVNHETRLYGSIDSPHQGANVPLGYQAAVRYLYGESILGVGFSSLSPDLKQGYKVVNSPAAKQMLYYQLAGQGSSISIYNDPHNNFMAEYTEHGLPQMWGIRNIAIANGSECAQNQGYAPYTKLISANGTKDINYLSNLFAGILGIGTSYPISFFEGFITTDADVILDMDIHSLPDRQAQRIFYFKLSYRKEILWGAATSTDVLLNKSFYSTTELLAIDSSPGGASDVNKFGSLPTNLAGFKITVHQSRFGFVPTFSSLDVGSATQPILSTDLLRTYSPAFPPTGSKSIPFNNFFSNPLSNEFHPQLTTNNGRWLFKEIQGTPELFSCSSSCVGTNLEPIISGPSIVCDATAQFIINNAAPQYQTTWQVVPAELFSSSSGVGQEVNLQVLNPGGVGGNAVIRYTLQSGCGQTIFEKSFNVGTPLVPAIAPPGPLYKEPNQIVQLIVPDVSDQIEWSFEGSSNSYTYTFSPSGLECNFIPTAAGTYRVKTRSTFGCGFSDYSTVEIICRYNRPDLTIENLYVSTSFGSISFYYDVVNLGVTTANSPTVSYFWSSNTTYEQGTDQLIGSITTGDIPPQGRVPISTTYQSNKSKTYALVFADPNNLILEQNENNNLFFRQAIIPTRSPSPPQTFSAYPIPFNQELKINFTTNDGEIANSKEVFIIDFLDNSTKFKRNTTEDSITINTGFLSSGKYVLVVNSSMGYESLLIIKE
jgi:hypothetical protein